MFDDPMNLSQSAQARRERILRLALAEARGRRQQRQIVRVSVLAILVMGVFTAVLSRRAEGPAAVPVVIDRPVAPTTAPALQITYIQTDPTIVERLSIRPGPRSWRIIGDDELLDALAAAGQPAGIVYHDGKATLLPR